MNKIYGLVLLCAGLMGTAYAQTPKVTEEADTSYWYNNKAVFEKLDTKNIPSGLLMDYGMTFAEMDRYDGQSLDSDNEVSAIILEQINASLLSAQITGMRNAPSGHKALYQKLHSNVKKNHIRIAGLLYQYQRLDTGKADNITVADGRLYDKYAEGVYQSPYQTRNVFAMALSVDRIHGSSFTIELPSGLWQSNMDIPVAAVRINTDDGQGWQTVALGSNFPVTYTTAGDKHWLFEVELIDGSKWLGNGGVNVIQNETADFTTTITGTTPYLGEVTSAHISIDYAPGHSSLVRPLIIVEGFDAGDVLVPEDAYGFSDMQNDFQTDLAKIHLENSLNSLLVNLTQYDRVYIDWDNGSDYLERNANLLKDIIKWVNDTKNNAEQSVLWGFSMGGVIGRYALKDLEDDGYNHQVRLFISHDAPHQGANVPYGTQCMAAHLSSMDIDYGQISSQIPAGALPVTGSEAIVQALSLGTRPAAQQMLASQYSFDPSTSWFTPYNVEGPAMHAAWQQKLKEKGYPACRNIAIANGSECGQPQAVSHINPLFSLNAEARVGYLTQMGLSIAPVVNWVINIFSDNPEIPTISLPTYFGSSGLWNWIPGANYYKADFKVRSNLGGISGNVYSGRLRYTKSIFWLIDVSAFNYTKSVSVNLDKAWDRFSGGALSANMGPGHIDTSRYGFRLKANFYAAARFGFVPTVSALDIGGNNSAIPPAVYYSTFTGTQPPAAPYQTPFAGFITGYAPDGDIANNEPHIALTDRNAAFVGQEIAYNTTTSTNSCTNGCADKQISGAEMVCSGGNVVYDIPFTPYGNDYVTWSITPATNAALLTSGNECTVTNQNDQGTFTLTATINTDCGPAHYTKQIYMGNPGFWLAVTQLNNQKEVVSIGPNCIPGISQVQWNVPYVANQTQTYPVQTNGWPCWFFNHQFSATSNTYPITVNATVITPCGAQHLSYDYTYNENSGGPNPNNPYAGNSGSGGDNDDPSGNAAGAGSKDDRMTVSPNPTKNYWKLNSFGKSGTYTLSGITGKRIIKKTPFTDKIAIGTKKMAKGIYLLQVETATGTRAFKLVKE